MIVAQLGLSLTLLVGAALVARSFWGLLSVDPGFSVDHAVTMAMRPSMEAAPFYEAVGERVRALPGVESAGFISTLPLGPGGNTSNNVFAAGPSRLGAGQSIQASWRLVDGGYFEAMRIPLLRGRTFDGLAPDEARRSIVLSASLAKALFGDDDPVGRQVDPGGNNRLLRVIGVVGDVRNRRLAADPLPAFYWSFHRFTYGPMRLVVKSQLPAEQIVAAVRREVRAVDPGAPIFQVWTLDDVRAESLSQERLLLRMLWAFAGTALLLAALGTYGVVAFAVQQRTREFGIRLAIGADAARVRALVLRQAMRPGPRRRRPRSCRRARRRPRRRDAALRRHAVRRRELRRGDRRARARRPRRRLVAGPPRLPRQSGDRADRPGVTRRTAPAHRSWRLAAETADVPHVQRPIHGNRRQPLSVRAEAGTGGGCGLAAHGRDDFGTPGIDDVHGVLEGGWFGAWQVAIAEEPSAVQARGHD